MELDQKFLAHFNLSEKDYSKVQHDLLLHKEVVADYQKMQHAAEEDGIQLRLLSSYRSFEQQLSIWNGKASGQRIIRNDDEMIINIEDLNQEELIRAIMRFSAIPGLSRHHFGTDMDVYDPSAVDANYKVKLVPSEYENEGPFGKLNNWLDKNLESFNFYRPYSHDFGKLAQEPWHISHREMSKIFVEQLTKEKMLSFYNHFNEEQFHLVEMIKENLDSYLKDYIEPYY